MSTRLQVVVDESELAGYKRAADRRGVTVSEWVRQTLRRAQQEASTGDVAGKLEALRVGAGHAFPTGAIDEMLAEIEHGYLDGPGATS
jgi:hypothetical protein